SDRERYRYPEGRSLHPDGRSVSCDRRVGLPGRSAGPGGASLVSKKNFSWRVPPTKGYDANRYVKAVDEGVFSLLNNYWAVRLENDAKQTAPWTDRTSNARQTLAAYAVRVPRSGSVQAVFVSDGEQLLPCTYTPGGGGA